MSGALSISGFPWLSPIHLSKSTPGNEHGARPRLKTEVRSQNSEDRMSNSSFFFLGGHIGGAPAEQFCCSIGGYYSRFHFEVNLKIVLDENNTRKFWAGTGKLTIDD